MVNIQILKIACKLRCMNQTELAHLAGVSRQAISLWFADGEDSQRFIDLKWSRVQKLSESLKLPVAYLAQTLPLFDDPKKLEELKNLLLWDRLYQSFTDYVIALSQFKRDAVGRFVQVFGIYEAAATLGQKVWKDFDNYKKYIHPKLREQNEKLCHIHLNLNKN